MAEKLPEYELKILHACIGEEIPEHVLHAVWNYKRALMVLGGDQVIPRQQMILIANNAMSFDAIRKEFLGSLAKLERTMIVTIAKEKNEFIIPGRPHIPKPRAVARAVINELTCGGARQ